MRRVVGWLLILHAIAHANTGTWAVAQRPIWLALTLWCVAVVGFMAAGLGLLRAPRLRDVWKPLTLSAAIASIGLGVWSSTAWSIPGIAIDLVLLALTFGPAQPRFDADIDVVRAVGAKSYRHPHWVRAGWTIGAIALAYVALVVVARPMSLRWGTTADERAASMPGDEVFESPANYRIDHGITIRAPASAVWPWLVQLGQDRGGFYSYDWLERAVGDDIQNADRIHPEWQSRAVGDTIFATQRSYFGGRFGGLGWRVNTLQAHRVIGLENWGTFVLCPIDSATTRLIVRTRGQAPPSIASFVLAPVNVFVFEPMHFIMERGMLRGIRARAEGASPSN
jgi:hypothetical protein